MLNEKRNDDTEGSREDVSGGKVARENNFLVNVKGQRRVCCGSE